MTPDLLALLRAHAADLGAAPHRDLLIQIRERRDDGHAVTVASFTVAAQGRAEPREAARPCAEAPPPSPADGEPLRLTATQNRILAALADGPAKGDVLARRLGVQDRSSITRPLRALKDAGLVALGPDGYTLTDAGHDTLPE